MFYKTKNRPENLCGLILGLYLLITLCSPVVHAQEFPDQPFTLVVGFGIGGSVDRMTRVVSNYLAEELGQPVQVINRNGAGTLLAANYVLGRPHDGYTIFASAFSPYLSNTILEGNADYSIDDFSYINFQWFDEDLIALSKASKYKNLQKFFQTCKNRLYNA